MSKKNIEGDIAQSNSNLDVIAEDGTFEDNSGSLDAENLSLHSSLTLMERLNMVDDTRKSKLNPYRELDERRREIYDRIKQKFKAAPKTLLQKAEETKTGIERQLEDSDKRLNELITFGDELVDNIKVANEKRELLRKAEEFGRKSDLEENVKKESVQALAQFDDITSRWVELGTLKEPMALYENMNKQKDRIALLMQNKDDIIEQCQQEIDKLNKRYYADQEKQDKDICHLIERIDNQIELIKEAYKEHIGLLETTIEDERQNIAMNEANKWNSFYDTVARNQELKFEICKEKEKFYATEIERIVAKQEEITRSTRIRLEKDAEMLEWELRKVKNNVLMNSEKLDYNYQILQKRNEENIVINNQQKRRVAKIHEGISSLKKKIQALTSKSEVSLRKLSLDIQKLHSSISELEKKSLQFKQNNKRKFDRVWEINFKEIKSLLTKVFEIDRILHEQQLILPYVLPEVDLHDINKKPKQETNQVRQVDTKDIVEKKYNNSDEVEVRFLRNILRKIADRAGFLVEEKLLKILEPYAEEEECLVRIDNIFTALRINDMKVVKSLTKCFKPFAWCPNCSTTISQNKILKLYGEHHKNEKESIYVDIQNQENENKVDEKDVLCNNHYLMIEPTLVLTALNEFTKQKFEEDRNVHNYNWTTDQSQVNLITLENDEIKKFWERFLTYVPIEKQKLWMTLEHGLNHYLEVLKQREELNNECIFLRRQNVELKHLLKKFDV